MRVEHRERGCSPHGPRRRGDVAVLAGQVAGLAGLWRLDLARVQLAAVGGVQVRHGGGTVSVRGDGELVDVVDYGERRSVLC